MADVQVGPRGGHFVTSRNGLKRWIGGARAKVGGGAKAPRPAAAPSTPSAPQTQAGTDRSSLAYKAGHALGSWVKNRARPFINNVKHGEDYARNPVAEASGSDKPGLMQRAKSAVATAGYNAARKVAGMGGAGGGSAAAAGKPTDRTGRLLGAVKQIARHPVDALKSWASSRGFQPNATSAAAALGQYHAKVGADRDKAKDMGKWMKGRKMPSSSFDKLQKDLGAQPAKKVHPAGTRADVDGFRKASGKKGLPSAVVDHIAKGRPVRYKGKTYDTKGMQARRAGAKSAPKGGKGGKSAPKGKGRRR